MNNVLDVCRYIINYSNRQEYGISNLKLQKILYFIQAAFLCYTKTHKPCFPEEIEAWDFGPVVPVAYHEFKQYGGCDIPTIETYIDIDFDNIWNSKRIIFNENIISVEDRETINAVVDRFAEYTATDLVALTHNQSPWRDVYVPHQNNIITQDSIRSYFSE